MEKELLIKLNEVRKELEIPKDDFIKIIALANRRRSKSKLEISDEMLYEIILDSLASYDYDNKSNNNEEKKAAIEGIRLLINGERKERHLSDNMLFDFIEDYLNIIENREIKEKNSQEMVERSSKSLGF